MLEPRTRRQQYLDLPAEQLGSPVAEKPLGLRIDDDDVAALIHDDDRVGSRFQQILEFLVRLPASAHVAHNLGESGELSATIIDRGDDHIRPERRSILAYPPAFLLEAAFGERDPELVLRLLASHLLRRVELRKVPADNLLGTVALDA